MPTYTFIDKKTKEEKEIFCTLAEREEMLKTIMRIQVEVLDIPIFYNRN